MIHRIFFLLCLLAACGAARAQVLDGDTLREVIVSSRSAQKRVADVQIGIEKIDVAELARVPALFGERDIIKGLQLLPGVKAESDGSVGYEVRGGTPSQNLILLDQATIYNAGHLMGLFSAFNDDALTNATLYKGMMPAQFGGASSSVLDIDTHSGNHQSWRYGLTGGLLSAKVFAEGPLVADRLSLFVAARRSYMDLIARRLRLIDKDNVLNYYDVNAKLDFRADDRHRLTLSLYRGRDNLGADELFEMGWGNTAATLSWLFRPDDRFYTRTSLIGSHYGSDVGIDILNTHYSMAGHIRHLTLRHALSWQPWRRHRLTAGVQGTLTSLKSAEWKINALHEREQHEATDYAAWVGDVWTMASWMELSAGLRLDGFRTHNGPAYHHAGLEPRGSLKVALSPEHSLRLGYSHTTQNIHAVRNSSMSLPFDRYTMTSGALVHPQQARQVSLGYSGMVANGAVDFSLEGYYKRVNNVYDYSDGKSFYSDIRIENILLGGRGRAYGAELALHKNTGRLTGWLSYTLSWVENQIDGISENRWYTASNDRRHDVSLVAMYQLNDRWDVTATWKYNTGQALTAPSAKYDIGVTTYYYYAERNGYRSPAYHRLDFAANYTTPLPHGMKCQWSFGVYNAYCRYNPFVINFENDDDSPTGTKTFKTALFGIIPSVSVTIK